MHKSNLGLTLGKGLGVQEEARKVDDIEHPCEGLLLANHMTSRVFKSSKIILPTYSKEEEILKEFHRENLGMPNH